MSSPIGFPKYLWHLGSHDFDLKYEPESLLRLGKMCFDGYYVPKDKNFAEFVHNMLVKYGFMNVSTKYLSETINGKQIETNYHLSAFISYTKAFLDAISNILNYHYELNCDRSQIDLKHKSFRDKLRNYDEELAKRIEKQIEWIDNVVFWRDSIIHKKSPLFIFWSKSKEDEKYPEDTTVRMPKEPITIFNWENEISQLKKKYENPVQEILPFCESWIREADVLLQKTCERLCERFEEQPSRITSNKNLSLDI